VSKEKSVVIGESSQQEETAERSGTILIVDDEPQLRDIAARMLKSLGYTVDSVCSGELAIKYILDKPMDLIVIDMQMEPGMNGYETYLEISKIYPEQKAVIVSGFSDSADVKATLKLGANGFIKKPYSLDQLGRAVNEALRC
jgi:DNA-binding NtrC family response regulator